MQLDLDLHIKIDLNPTEQMPNLVSKTVQSRFQYDFLWERNCTQSTNVSM